MLKARAERTAPAAYKCVKTAPYVSYIPAVRTASYAEVWEEVKMHLDLPPDLINVVMTYAAPIDVNLMASYVFPDRHRAVAASRTAKLVESCVADPSFEEGLEYLAQTLLTHLHLLVEVMPARKKSAVLAYLQSLLADASMTLEKVAALTELLSSLGAPEKDVFCLGRLRATAAQESMQKLLDGAAAVPAEDKHMYPGHALPGAIEARTLKTPFGNNLRIELCDGKQNFDLHVASNGKTKGLLWHLVTSALSCAYHDKFKTDEVQKPTLDPQNLMLLPVHLDDIFAAVKRNNTRASVWRALAGMIDYGGSVSTVEHLRALRKSLLGFLWFTVVAQKKDAYSYIVSKAVYVLAFKPGGRTLAVRAYEMASW